MFKKVLSHTDADGIGCVVLLNEFFLGLIKTELHNYDTLEDRIIEYINNKEYIKEEVDMIFITDLNVSESVLDLLYKVTQEDKIKVQIIDHHTKKGMHMQDKHPEIAIVGDGSKSATLMVYEYLTSSPELMGSRKRNHEKRRILLDRLRDNVPTLSGDEILEGYRKFAQIISDYDTWAWAKNNDPYPEKLSMLYYLDKDNFEDNMHKRIYFGKDFINKEELKTIDSIIMERESLINDQNNKIIKIPIENYTVGVLFLDEKKMEHRSMLGNRLMELNSDVDLIAMFDIYNSNVSFRTNKTEVDLNEFAKRLNGGGHPMASGGEINKELKEKIALLLLTK